MEFSEIQPVSTNRQLQATPINNAADLVSFFNSRANAGDQVEMFFTFAERQPEKACKAFNEVIQKLANPPLKALALQGFGRLPLTYKQALASCVSAESQELLKLLGSEVRNRSSDLTTWAAAEALREISFRPSHMGHTEHGNLPEIPERIQKEILDQKIQELNKVQRLNSRGQFTAKYERFLEFWIYGPTEQLLNENLTSQGYLDIVDDVLHLTQIRGMQLGLNSRNKRVSELSLEKAKFIFQQYADSSQGGFKENLGDSLKRFLKDSNNTQSDLLVLIQAFICKYPEDDINNRKLSNLTIGQIKQKISSIKSFQSEILSTFPFAISISEERVLSRFLEKKLIDYSQLAKTAISQFTQQVTLMEEKERQEIALIEEKKSQIKINISVLSSIFQELLKIDIDSHLRDDLEILHEDLLALNQAPQTMNKCKEVEMKLQKIKNIIFRVRQDVSLMEEKKSQIKINISELSSIFQELLKIDIDSYLRGDLEILHGDLLALNQAPQTINKCEEVEMELQKIKKTISSALIDLICNLDRKIRLLKAEPTLWDKVTGGNAGCALGCLGILSLGMVHIFIYISSRADEQNRYKQIHFLVHRKNNLLRVKSNLDNI